MNTWIPVSGSDPNLGISWFILFINITLKMSLALPSEQPCQHSRFCPHRMYEKCPDERARQVSLLFPKRHVEVQANPAIHKSKAYKSNIPTLAYEKYLTHELDLQQDENFVKDFYATGKGTLQESINIIELTEKQMAAGNAYVLAEVEKGQFKERERKRINTINAARKKAVTHYNDYFGDKKKQKEEDKEETAKYLKKLFTKLEEVADHIVRGSGEKQTDKEKEFLKTKDYLNCSYLSGIKIRKPKNAIQILQQLRVLLQKHKLKHQTQRQQIQANRSMTQSFITQTSMQSNDSQSRISQTNTVDGSQAQHEQQVINKYCDLVALQKKWKKNNIDEVKDVLRRVVMNKVLLERQKRALKDKLKEKQVNQRLARENPELAKKLKQQKEKAGKKDAKEGDKQPNKSQLSTHDKKIEEDEKPNLPKEELEVKKLWMKSGRFNPPGELFQRTNNYTKLFAQKFKDTLFNFELKDTAQDFNKDQATECTCTCKCPCSP